MKPTDTTKGRGYGKNDVPMRYFQIDPSGMKVIATYNSMAEVGQAMEDPNMKVYLSNYLRRKGKHTLRIKGYFWAALAQDYVNAVSEERANYDAVYEVQDLAFKFYAREKKIKSIPKDVLMRINRDILVALSGVEQ